MNEGNIQKHYSRIPNVALCVFLSLALITSLCVPTKKAHAFAPVVGGEAALAALAVELGISEVALMSGLVAIGGATTGLYLLRSSDGSVTLDDTKWRELWNGNGTVNNPGYSQNWDEAYRKYKLGNSKSWDELTDEEKAHWSNPAEYVQSQWLGYALENSLIQTGDNGGFEPTPEPDPEQDPSGNQKYHKLRNVLTLLGVGGGAVALNELGGVLGDIAGSNLRSFLFGDEGLGYSYTATYQMNNCPIQFAYLPARDVTIVNDTFHVGETQWEAVRTREDTGQTSYFLCRSDRTTVVTPSMTFTQWSGKNNLFAPKPDGTVIWRPPSSFGTPSYIFAGGVIDYEPGYVTQPLHYCLNAMYAGTYIFPDGKTYSNGIWSEEPSAETVEYGQIAQTPNGLSSTILNDAAHNTFLNNYTNTGTEGWSRAVNMPSNFDNVSSYDSFINVVPDTDLVPVPDDQPVNVNPNPNPNPNPDNTDFSQEVQRLLQQPFNQLFPFCLIGDLQRLLGIIKDAAYDENSGLRTQSLEPDEVNGTTAFEIPLHEFGVEGLDDISIDLLPLSDLAEHVRPMLTALFITGLLVGTFRFFLNRGGE